MQVTLVGNYPKIGAPSKAPNLRTAIRRSDEGGLSAEELMEIERQVTLDVLEQQAEAGIDLVTDGQVRWDDGQTHFAKAIGGFDIGGLIRYFDTNTYYRQPEVTGPVTWNGPITLEEFRFAQEHSRKPVKAVITGPYTLARLSKPGIAGSVKALAVDLAAVLNQEAKALEEAGAEFIQFDEPAICWWPEDLGILQEASAVVTGGLRAKTAMYTWFRDVAQIAPDLFRLPYQVFGLDFVWGPSNWEALAHFPADKELGLGIMDARNTRLEPVEAIVADIRRAAEFVALDRLYVNPSAGLDYLPRQSAYDKMVRLVEGAARVSPGPTI